MKRMALALLVVGVVTTAPAEGALLGSSVDEGSVPTASASGWIYGPARGPLLRVTAWPPEPVEVSLDVQCEKGRMNRSVDRRLPLATPPLEIRIALTIRRPDECHVDATAWYENEVDGRIAVTIRTPAYTLVERY